MNPRRRREIPITDETLSCFVQWCRVNPPDVVDDVDTARRVLNAYAYAQMVAP